MNYNFDTEYNRQGTDALKLEGMQAHWGRTDLIPLWVADMDFATAPFIMNAISERCQHPILGYTCKPDAYFDAIIHWVGRRYSWVITAEMIQFSPGIVPGLAFAIQCFTQKGDGVLMQPPVYHPFFLVTEKNERVPVYNPLILEDGRYRMDFDLLKQQLTPDCKLFILCNPHNPGGKVWSREDLVQLAELCYDHNILVISDEIHADLTLPGVQHIPFATISEKARMNSVTFMAASKAFNIPGLSSAYAVIPNPELKQQFTTFIENSELGNGHAFAFLSVVAAYNHGEEWLNQVTQYIQGNVDYLDQFLQTHTPLIKAIRPEASYLVFLDCRDMGLNNEALTHFFVEKAGLALSDGYTFGKEGSGFMRINIGCTRLRLEEALNMLKIAYEQQLIYK